MSEAEYTVSEAVWLEVSILEAEARSAGLNRDAELSCLLVADSIVCAFIRKSLETLPPLFSKYLQATEQKSARALLNSERVRLVICDAALPNLDAYDFCRSLLVDDRKKPVILLAQPGAVETEWEMALASGADWLLFRPFDAIALREAVRRLTRDVPADGDKL